MKIKEIEAFIAVVEENGIVKAAERLYCVPSNISKLINELELRNKNTLFNRDGRELRITPYGRYFYEQSKKLIESVDNFKDRTFKSQENKLIIGGIDVALDYFLPEHIFQYQLKNKNISFDIFRGYSSALEQKVSNHEYDLIFSDGPLNSPRLNSKLVFAQQLLLAKNIKLEDNIKIYTYGKQCSYRDYIEFWAINNLNSFKIIEIESYPLMLNLINNGLGISFIPNSIIQQYSKFNHLVDPSICIDCNIYIIWNKLNCSKSLIEFIDYFSFQDLVKNKSILSSIDNTVLPPKNSRS